LVDQLTVREAGALEPGEVLRRLQVPLTGLTAAEAANRFVHFGSNELQRRSAGPLDVLIGQLKNPLLLLLAATAIVALVLHDRTDAVIIIGIVVLSVGLGFVNEYRSVRAVADLQAQVRQRARVVRDGALEEVAAATLVPGDLVALTIGDIVPADLRLLEALALTCDEAALSGESLPTEKSIAVDLEASVTPRSCALMGTIVRSGRARGIVVATGDRTQIGSIAARIGSALPETAFQQGLRAFSGLLVWITTVVTSVVFVINALVHHSVLESLLFALAIAVSLTPQLLPAIVTVSLARGARRMAKQSVLVKRLVSIEDLGNMVVLFTDKTGTLTQGRLSFSGAFDRTGAGSAAVLRLGLLCTQTSDTGVHGGVIDALDAALWASPNANRTDIVNWRRLADVPFDFERRLMSILVDDGKQRLLITKGSPESIVARCTSIAAEFPALIAAQFAAGSRVIAIATRDATGMTTPGLADERGLEFAGLLVFSDPPKADAAASIARLERLGIRVKIITGDNELVAQKICRDLDIPTTGTLTGTQIAALSDAELRRALETTSIFARVSPEQKARLITVQRAAGVDVGFLGDGVNDAVALHDADVGISVESATDVARDAADVVLVTKDLGILADGVIEGRRIFANTIKYVLMGTSSNFGNMLSTAVGSIVLPFLPLLPSQILLNNLLYDVSEMTIPTDNVDEEQIQRPAHWDMRLVRRFMLVFGPINALMDFSIFAVLLFAFHAGPTFFRSGFFVESFITQTLIIFAIRTRRVPFFRSRPSRALAATTIGVAIVGAGLPFVPSVGAFFGFEALPPRYFALLIGLVLVYLGCVETAKSVFFRRSPPPIQRLPPLKNES